MKRLRVILLVALVLALLCALIACNGKEHTHTYADAWTQNGTYHWHTASCGHADETRDRAEHIYINGSCPICGRAEKVSEAGLEYELTIDKNSYRIIGAGTVHNKELVIPAIYQGLPVTAIGASAFKGCTELTSITIPDSVTTVGSSAFEGCIGLMNITIPSSVTSIGKRAFFECTGLTSATIPFSVATIREESFSGCAGLTSITIPSGVTRIENFAFSDCTGLTSITIPDSVTNISNSAFAGCFKLAEMYNLSKLNITAGSGIGEYALAIYTTVDSASQVTVTADGFRFFDSGDSAYLLGYSGSKTNLILPEKSPNGKDYYIYKYAFSGCMGLTSLTIPAGVIGIGESAFGGCFKLVEIYNFSNLNIIKGSYDNGSVGSRALEVYTTTTTASHVTETADGFRFFETDDIVYLLGYTGTETDLTLPEKSPSGQKYSIYKYAFSGCTELTSITFPNSLTSTGDYAFYGCTGLTSVLIPDSVTTIGPCAFYGCTRLTSVLIPDSVTAIGQGAFSDCTGLTSITIPDSVTTIGSMAFYGCEKLEYIVIPRNVSEIGIGAFYKCYALKDIVFAEQEGWWYYRSGFGFEQALDVMDSEENASCLKNDGASRLYRK